MSSVLLVIRIVLVCFSLSVIVTVTEYHRLGNIKKKDLCCMLLEVVKTEFIVLHVVRTILLVGTLYKVPRW
jgi:hypothetical protein